jgi:hypothetical protein
MRCVSTRSCGLSEGQSKEKPETILRKRDMLWKLFCPDRPAPVLPSTPASEAVEAATAGCTVCLPAGIFEGNLVIRQPIRILSRDHWVCIRGVRGCVFSYV